MKKVMVAAVCAACVGWAGLAMADTSFYDAKYDSFWADSYEELASGVEGYGQTTEYSYRLRSSGGSAADELIDLVTNASTAMGATDVLNALTLTINLVDDEYEFEDSSSTGDAEDEKVDLYINGALVDSFGLNGAGYRDYAYSGDLWTLLGSDLTLSVQLKANIGDVYVWNIALAGSFYTPEPTPSAVPEPATFVLFGAGLAGCAALGRRKR